MQTEKEIVIGIGEILWDILPDNKVLGGAPANFAYHASQFGFDGYVISAIGKDEPGEEILKTLEEKQLDYVLPETDYPTGTVRVTLDGKGIPAYEICENVAWDHIPLTLMAKERVRTARALSFGTLAQRCPVSRETIHRLLETAPEESLKIFDINLRQRFYTPEIISDSLEHCNVFKINDEELILLSRMFGYKTTDLQEICKTILFRYRLKMLILTCGTNGSYVFAPGEMSYMETPRVKVADTVGAGDSFTATFCVSILKGKALCEAHRLAVDVAAYVCTQHGAMPVLPEKLTERLK